MAAQPDNRSLLAELKRRNVLRAAVLYVGAVWALAQGIAQLTPVVGAPEWAARWFLIAAIIGFPFWIAFAWFFAWTAEGFKRESELPATASVAHSARRTLDFWIIGVLAVAVVLLLTNQLVSRQNAEVMTSAVDANALAATLAALPAQSIAVLPFENLSSDKDNDYFVAGMQDLILTKLADIGSLKVISRTSTQSYESRPGNLKQVAVELGVATILEGSVQKQGNAVLVNVQLIDARSDSHLWAQSYTRTLDNVFGVEGEVAGRIATALSAKLSPAQHAQLTAVPTTNRAAFDSFLRAEYAYHQTYAGSGDAGFKTAIALYRQAVAEDPNFALAFARLSYAESYLAFVGGAGEDVAQLKTRAHADADRALALQPELTAAKLALGYCDYYGKRDYPAALKTFAAVLAAAPNDADALLALGAVQRRSGQIDDSIDSLTRAVALDPRNFQLTYELGNTYMMRGRHAEGERWYQRALSLQPDSVSARCQYANAIAFGSGDLTRAIAAIQGDDPGLVSARILLLAYQRKFDAAIALLQSVPDNTDNFPPGGSKQMNLGVLYWQAGDKAQARTLFTKALALDRAALGTSQGMEQVAVLTSVATDEIGSGQVEAGKATAAQAEALLAQHSDALQGPNQMLYVAMDYAMAERSDLAVPLLATALAAPGSGLHYSPLLLWLDPAWDPIRSDVKFQALLQSYASYKPAVIPTLTSTPQVPRTGS